MYFRHVSVVALLCFSHQALSAFQPPLPTLKGLKKAVSATHAKYSEMVVEWETGGVHDHAPGTVPVPYDHLLYRLERAEPSRLMERWQLAAGQKTREESASHYLFAFDGSRSTGVELMNAGSAKRRGQSMVIVQPGLDRRLLSCSYPFDYYEDVWKDVGHQSLDEEIGDIECSVEIVGWEDMGGVPLLSVLLSKKVLGPEGIGGQRRMWLDPAHDWMAARTDILIQRPGADWTRLNTKFMSDFREVGGTWVPFKIEYRDPDPKPGAGFQTLIVSHFEFGAASVRKELIESPIRGPAVVRDEIAGVIYALDKAGVKSDEKPSALVDARMTAEAREYVQQANESRAWFQKQDAERAARHQPRRYWSWAISGGGVCVALAGTVLWRFKSRAA